MSDVDRQREPEISGLSDNLDSRAPKVESRERLLRDLLIRVEEGSGIDRNLDRDILVAIGGAVYRGNYLVESGGDSHVNSPGGTYPSPTESVEASIAILERALPEFWHVLGRSSTTSHASIGPDYEDMRLWRQAHEDWPPAKFKHGFSCYLQSERVSSGHGRALLSCVLRAVLVRDHGYSD